MGTPTARLSTGGSLSHKHQNTESDRQYSEQAAGVVTVFNCAGRLLPTDIDPPTGAHVAKRVFGFGTALLVIILLSPLLALVALALKLGEGGPVLFAQERVGFKGRTFKCLKFRTMVVNAEQALKAHLATDPNASREWKETQKLRTDPRVTALGRLLRRMSLDELPQLFNVLMGDMSLVGPRPIVKDEIIRYGERIREYISVRPGITGLWQVSGRSNCTYEERVELDTRYSKETGFGTDIRILLRTIPALLRQEGSY